MNLPTRNDQSHAAISLAQSHSLTQYDPGQLLSNVAGAEHRELCAKGHCTFVVNAATFLPAYPHLRLSNPTPNTSLAHGYNIQPELRAALSAAWPEEHRLYAQHCLQSNATRYVS